ncbi:MAG: hypothetical protein RL641_870, partial [Candidatus Parcubacteria bacterium]
DFAIGKLHRGRPATRTWIAPRSAVCIYGDFFLALYRGVGHEGIVEEIWIFGNGVKFD